MANGEKAVITRESKITVGLAIAIIVLVTGGVAWINREITSITSKLERGISDLSVQLDKTLYEMKAIKTTVDRLTDGTMTRSEFIAWARLLAAQNKTMNVPIPRD